MDIQTGLVRTSDTSVLTMRGAQPDVPPVTDGVSWEEMCQREGHQLEIDVFGFSPTYDPDKISALRAQKPTFYRSVVEISNRQAELDWSAKHPSTDLADNLFQAVSRGLPRRLKSQLMFCCALGTVVDYFFGADGFLVLETARRCPVTIDLVRARNYWQIQKKKSDWLMTREDLEDYKKIQKYGLRMAQRLIEVDEARTARLTGRRWRERPVKMMFWH